MSRRSYYIDPAVFWRFVICLSIMYAGYWYKYLR